MADPICPAGMVLITPSDQDAFCINATEVPQRDYQQFVEKHPLVTTVTSSMKIEIIEVEETIDKTEQFTPEVAEWIRKGGRTIWGDRTACLKRLAELQNAGKVKSFTIVEDREEKHYNDDYVPPMKIAKEYSHVLGPNKPAVGMSPGAARYFCQEMYQGGHLPVIDQWNAACGKGPFCTKSGKLNPREAIVGRKGPADVGSTIPNENGVYDMMGNVWEWMEPVYASHNYFDLIIGGSWINHKDDPEKLGGYFTVPIEGRSDSDAPIVGFRCVAPPISEDKNSK